MAGRKNKKERAMGGIIMEIRKDLVDERGEKYREIEAVIIVRVR